MQALLFSSHADETAVLTTILQQAGMMVRAAKELSQAIETWPENPADLILVTLPPDSSKSLSQLRQMRGHTAVPIIVIADPIPEDHQINLMESGADLVVCRPYGVRLLLAQIKGILRRSAGVPLYTLPTLSQSGITLDPSTRTVQVENLEPKRLTQLEFRMLYAFITHPGKIISSENLVEHVWGYSGEGNRELVRGLVQRLRSKVEPEPHNPRYILTEPGVGYTFIRKPD